MVHVMVHRLICHIFLVKVHPPRTVGVDGHIKARAGNPRKGFMLRGRMETRTVTGPHQQGGPKKTAKINGDLHPDCFESPLLKKEDSPLNFFMFEEGCLSLNHHPDSSNFTSISFKRFPRFFVERARKKIRLGVGVRFMKFFIGCSKMTSILNENGWNISYRV